MVQCERAGHKLYTRSFWIFLQTYMLNFEWVCLVVEGWTAYFFLDASGSLSRKENCWNIINGFCCTYSCTIWWFYEFPLFSLCVLSWNCPLKIQGNHITHLQSDLPSPHSWGQPITLLCLYIFKHRLNIWATYFTPVITLDIKSYWAWFPFIKVRVEVINMFPQYSVFCCYFYFYFIFQSWILQLHKLWDLLYSNLLLFFHWLSSHSSIKWLQIKWVKDCAAFSLNLLFTCL